MASYPDASSSLLRGGVTMPPEWHAHERTWMCFPTNNYVGGDRTESAEAWSAVAYTIARFEPVVMIADAGAGEGARSFLDGTVEIIEFPIDDAWLRDSGPTFVHCADGRLGCVEWVFNGWEAQEWASWEFRRQSRCPDRRSRAGRCPFAPTSPMRAVGSMSMGPGQ